VIGEYLLTLLGNFQEGLMKLNLEPGVKMYSIDVWWNRLMKHDLWYIVTPALVIQSSYPAPIPQRILLDSGTHSGLIQSAAVPLSHNSS